MPWYARIALHTPRKCVLWHNSGCAQAHIFSRSRDIIRIFINERLHFRRYGRNCITACLMRLRYPRWMQNRRGQGRLQRGQIYQMRIRQMGRSHLRKQRILCRRWALWWVHWQKYQGIAPHDSIYGPPGLFGSYTQLFTCENGRLNSQMMCPANICDPQTGQCD